MRKRLFQIFLFAGLAFQAGAAEVSVAEAARAGNAWLAMDPALGCPLGRSVRDARTCRTPGGARFHVLRLQGGGFAVLSADTAQEPVVAFSEEGDLVEDARNPLWALLCRDFDAARTARAAGRATLASAPSPAEAKWARLLATNAVSRAKLAGARASVSDVRVAPFVKSAWGQTTAGGADCYNLLTPNNYYAGCVATAGAQIMRHLEWPRGNVPAFTNAFCAVDHGPATLAGGGGVYDWASMPLRPDAATPASQRLAIAGLVRDLGVACGMDYAAEGSGVGGYMLARAWTTYFGYASAMAYTLEGRLPADAVRRALVSNFDARIPVEVGLSGDGGHAVVGDGYGYSDGTLYYHFVMGWEGDGDAWYAPPDLAAGGYAFSSIGSLVYNIFPERSAGHTICSGRVLDASGRPVAGATVTSTDYRGEQLTTTTDAHGIYALILPSTWLYPLPYDLHAEYEGVSADLSLKVKMCISTVVAEDGTFKSDVVPAPAVNNLVDQDLVLAGLPGEGGGDEPPPAVDPPVVDPPVVDPPTDDPPDTAPAGDYFARPIAISGASGTHELVDTSAYTKESGEPIHSLRGNGSFYPEARSAWYLWTAPGRGDVTFRVSSRRKDGATTYYLHAMLAAYRGESLQAAERIALFDGFNADDSTSLTLTVAPGECVRLVVFAYADDPCAGPYSLSWEGNLELPSATQTTEVPVPHGWISARYPGTGDFEARAHASGANGRPVWQSYLLGLDPLDPASDLRITSFRLVDGAPVAEWNVTNENLRALGYDYRLKKLDFGDANLFRLVVEPEKH